jgi:hypothetical protein
MGMTILSFKKIAIPLFLEKQNGFFKIPLFYNANMSVPTKKKNQ